jgi:hypothetical protein
MQTVSIVSKTSKRQHPEVRNWQWLALAPGTGLSSTTIEYPEFSKNVEHADTAIHQRLCITSSILKLNPSAQTECLETQGRSQCVFQ